MLSRLTIMKYFTLFILLTLASDLFSQTVEVPPDSLIKRNRIKTITSYFNDESTKDELSEVWKFDLDGKLISRQLFDKEDTTLSMDLNFYKDNVLMETWNIGTWLKYDTVKTIYFYDGKKRVLKTITTGKFNPFNYNANGFKNTFLYLYVNDSVTLKKYEGDGLTARGSGTDSIIYNSDHTKKFLFNEGLNLKIIYKYNEQKQLISETQTTISNPNLIHHYNNYYYDNGQLIKEIIGHSVTGEKEKISEQEHFYINDNKGLISKIQRQRTFDTYKYEYYK
ncbi:MAG: hypothetical protein HXX09_12530 [Bacteroidetes bacterium]|nr:hypothetical protein [Bacteroidota bacterium]